MKRFTLGLGSEWEQCKVGENFAGRDGEGSDLHMSLLVVIVKLWAGGEYEPSVIAASQGIQRYRFVSHDDFTCHSVYRQHLLRGKAVYNESDRGV